MGNKLEIIFWDVQHGHCTYLKTPNGRHILIDLGIGSYDDKNATFSPILHLKNNWNVRQLDYVGVTHPHLDHIDDILNFDEVSPKVFCRPTQISNAEVMEGVREQDRPKFEKYCEINDRYSDPIPEDSPNNIRNENNWGGVKVQIFSPTSCNTNKFNNHSIVFVFEYLRTKIVVPGDNEKCSLEELMKLTSFKDAVRNSEILLAPHHGRENGYYNEFVDLVNPLVTVVSDGRFCDTSANGRYSAKSRGWDVWKKNNGEFINRKCLTTNSDGEVFATIEPSSDEKYKSILNVSIK